MELGARFWLFVVAVAIGAAVVIGIFFMLFGWAWYTWGFLGAFVFFSLIAIALAYVSDRRQEKRDREYAA